MAKKSPDSTNIATAAPLDGGQAIIRCLENNGVEYIWGYPGGSAIPIFDALITTKTKIKMVLVRHEQGATHMADGYARAHGQAGRGAGHQRTGGHEYDYGHHDRA